MAMDTKHTPEPWREGIPGTVVADIPIEGGPGGANGADAVAYYGGNLIGESMTRANARRIVACVNGCEGIPTKALEKGVVGEVIEALQTWERWQTLNPKGNDWRERSDAFQRAKRLTRLALIKLRHPDAKLAREQACGCVVCICDHETQCQGCGAKHCGTHPVEEIPYPLFDGIEDGASFTDVFRERARRGDA